MAILKSNWFLEPVFDFEYKTYEVLGYTHLLNNLFTAKLFYPYLDGLANHIKALVAYQEAKSILENKLERDIQELDFKTGRVIKTPVSDKHGVVALMQEIIEFADMQLKNCYNDASAEYDHAKKDISITPLGISETNQKQGILLFRKAGFTKVYSYSLRSVMRPGEADIYKDVKTNYLKDVNTGLFTNFNDIKWEIIRQSEFNIGTRAFLVETNTEIPHFEFVLPVVKKFIIEVSR